MVQSRTWNDLKSKFLPLMNQAKSHPMDFGLHLPIMDFGGNPFTLDHLIKYAETGQQLGFSALAVNDHLIYSKPWLDGPTALAAVVSHSGGMELATTVSLPVVRGPVPLAKSLGAIDRLSGGRLIACVGPGSSARDYAAVGIPFDERWKRLDEVIQALRALWNRDGMVFRGRFYNTEGIKLEPFPAQHSGPPIWVGSWGSMAGLQRVARLGDGWLASGYNTTPELFAKGWKQLQEFLAAADKDPSTFPNAVATMWFYITEDEKDCERMLNEVLAPTLNRPVAELRERLPIGPPLDCAKKLTAYQKVGVQRVYLWPLGDELEQIEILMRQVIPLIGGEVGAQWK
jgi:alkanesulfonate monooxygenase SsuD/methylene tetrahydromethanopterin reductase-like flavin-dependent oxidoreductase (luciferase family)